MNRGSTAVFLLVLCTVSEQRLLDCSSEDKIECKCEWKGTHKIVLINCTRQGGWSSWTEWSFCGRRNAQRRRRRCDSPTPLGKNCEGEHLQSQKCSHSEPVTNASQLKLPEFLWGSWSDWNEWGICLCPGNLRKRTRHCIGWECSGCGVDHGTCERRCVTERWWSDWSEWFSGASKVRHRSWCSLGIDGRSLVTMTINETLPTTPSVKSAWSEWELRPGVAFRYRVPENWILDNGSPNIQHQLIAYNSSTHVSLTFCLYLSTVTMISGFVAQCFVSRMFSLCATRKLRY